MSETGKHMQNGRRSLLRILFSRTMLITCLLILNFLYLFSVIFDLFKFVPILFGSMVVFTAVMELVILNCPNDADVKLTWRWWLRYCPCWEQSCTCSSGSTWATGSTAN